MARLFSKATTTKGKGPVATVLKCIAYSGVLICILCVVLPFRGMSSELSSSIQEFPLNDHPAALDDHLMNQNALNETFFQACFRFFRP